MGEPRFGTLDVFTDELLFGSIWPASHAVTALRVCKRARAAAFAHLPVALLKLLRQENDLEGVNEERRHVSSDVVTAFLQRFQNAVFHLDMRMNGVDMHEIDVTTYYLGILRGVHSANVQVEKLLLALPFDYQLDCEPGTLVSFPSEEAGKLLWDQMEPLAYEFMRAQAAHLTYLDYQSDTVHRAVDEFFDVLSSMRKLETLALRTIDWWERLEEDGIDFTQFPHLRCLILAPNHHQMEFSERILDNNPGMASIPHLCFKNMFSIDAPTFARLASSVQSICMAPAGNGHRQSHKDRSLHADGIQSYDCEPLAPSSRPPTLPVTLRHVSGFSKSNSRRFTSDTWKECDYSWRQLATFGIHCACYGVTWDNTTRIHCALNMERREAMEICLLENRLRRGIVRRDRGCPQLI